MKCLFCQCDKKEALVSASSSGIANVSSASRLRNDEIKHYIGDLVEILWHKSCYSSYTSKRNLSFLSISQNANLSEADEKKQPLDPGRSSRSKLSKLDWSLCMFCQKVKNKGIKTLVNVATLDACSSILQAAEVREDHALLTSIAGEDLIASEAKYHVNCRASYVSKTNLKHKAAGESLEECLYERSFQELLCKIGPGIKAGKAYDMSYLKERYQQILSTNGLMEEKYRSEKLKKRLMNFFQEDIVFHKQPDPSKPELVYSSKLSVKDILNAAAHASTIDTEPKKSKEDPDMSEGSKMKVLFKAAQILKGDIKGSKGIPIQPLSVDDVSLVRGREVIPDSLYQFLCWLISKQNEPETEVEKFPSDPNDEKRILMIGQDMVFTSTNSRVKTPKHVGLAMTLHHLTGSKQLVTLLNKMGHCSSYCDVEIINTSLAQEISAQSQAYGVVIPSNISPGVFVQCAADNNDLNEETLDGKQTTHATTLVVYQREAYGPKPPPKPLADHSKKRRSIDTSLPTQTIHDFGVRGKRPQVTAYIGTIQVNESSSRDEQVPNTDRRDFAWFLLRLNKGEALLSTDENADVAQQDTPSWSAFNTMVSANVPPRTNIGYCPMIQGSSTEFSTIYTVMKSVQAISAGVGQSSSVVTFDLAIYSKAKEIQWRYPNEFKDLTIRIGGFHIALNFLSVIGKQFKESGIEELLIESSLYGNATAAAPLTGKSCNRGVRAHKLIMEALLRLQWKAFCEWLQKADNTLKLEALQMDRIVSKLASCRDAIVENKLQEILPNLCESLKEIHLLFYKF